MKGSNGRVVEMADNWYKDAALGMRKAVAAQAVRPAESARRESRWSLGRMLLLALVGAWLVLVARQGSEPAAAQANQVEEQHGR
jgi:hypothetical protein